MGIGLSGVILRTIFDWTFFSRHRDFKGATVGKASVMAMCGEKSGGVVQVYIIPTVLFTPQAIIWSYLVQSKQMDIDHNWLLIDAPVKMLKHWGGVKYE